MAGQQPDDASPTTADEAPPAPAPPVEAEPREPTAAESGDPQGTLPSVDTSPQGEPRRPPPPEEEEAEEDPNAYKVKLDVFEGPLDLLLHLIRKHELDILDIPISFITKKYLEYLDMMTDLAIDVASEYLVMAATLAYIKSRTLLPVEPGDDGEEEEEEDPRSELVRRLLEYQKYKHVAAQLRSRATMGKEMFERGTSEPEPEGPAPLADISVFKLFDAFDKVLKRANQKADHKVLFERVTITERIVELTELLNARRQMRFMDLFFDDEAETASAPSKGDLVVTFLALLEMCKMRLARIRQEDALGELIVEVRSKHIDDRPSSPGEPASGEPVSEGPVSERPVSEGPVSEGPVSGEPASEGPVSGEPASGEPEDELADEVAAEPVPAEDATSPTSQDVSPDPESSREHDKP